MCAGKTTQRREEGEEIVTCCRL